MEKTKNRESNVELLRIIASVGVIILHYNNHDMGGGFKYTLPGSSNSILLHFLECVFICAVDLFLLITGYYMAEKKPNDQPMTYLKKIIYLVLQVIIFNQVSYMISSQLSGRNISIYGIINNLLQKNYFVVQYSVVYLLSPYLNRTIDSLCRKELNQFAILLFICLSVCPTIADVVQNISREMFMGINTISMYGDDSGYTLINFILMYFVGCYIRKVELCNYHINKRIFLLLLLLLWCVLFVWRYIGLRFYEKISATSYCNPVVIMCAVITFVIFKRINIKNNRIINELAGGAFTVFLTHQYVISVVGVKYVAQQKTIILFIHIIIVCICLYIFGYACYKIYSYLCMLAIKLFTYIKRV